MKKLSLVVLVLGVGLIFFVCGGNIKGYEMVVLLIIELVIMKLVDNINIMKRSEVIEKSSIKFIQSKDKLMEEKVFNIYQLVEDFGNVYVNFFSINDCNENLKKLMIVECIKKNGIDVKIGVKLESKGEVSLIY